MSIVLRVLFVFLFFSKGLGAQELRIPPMSQPVIDQVGLMSSRVVASLSEILRALHAQTGTQMAILVTQDTQGLSLEEFSIKIVENWKLGSEKSDRGALLLIVRGERKIRIEVGRGLEGELTDLRSRDIIDNKITPAFRKGDFDLGVTQGLVAMIQYSEPDFSLDNVLKVRKQSADRSREPAGVTQGVFLFFLLKILLLGFGFFAPPELRSQFRGRGRWGGGGFGGGFGGSGGWSGGGGSFGGGGASGGW